MKQKTDFILMEVGKQNIVVCDTEDGDGPSGMIWLNSTGVFLWEQLAEDITAEELAERLANKYNISLETARADVDTFLRQLQDGEALEL